MDLSQPYTTHSSHNCNIKIGSEQLSYMFTTKIGLHRRTCSQLLLLVAAWKCKHVVLCCKSPDFVLFVSELVIIKSNLMAAYVIRSIVWSIYCSADCMK